MGSKGEICVRRGKDAGLIGKMEVRRSGGKNQQNQCYRIRFREERT